MTEYTKYLGVGQMTWITDYLICFVVVSLYSTVTDCSLLTQNDLYVPYLTFIYHCKTNRFIFHKKELIETCEYMDFDIGVMMRG